MRFPFRVLVPACIHPETYKYFLAPGAAPAVWQRLSAELGPVRTLPGVHVLQIEHDAFLVRAAAAGNPITVIRTAHCRETDVAKLHDVLGFEEPSA